jgi:hypothetical protein
MPAWPACVPGPRPTPPTSTATTLKPPGSMNWLTVQALYDAYRQREDVFAVIMADRAGQGADLAASQAGHPAVRARLERAAYATPIWRQPIDCGWFTQRR